MNTVEKIKAICKERNVPISRLEKSCGFANGYIGQLRKGTIPADRLAKIASFLDLNIEDLLGVQTNVQQIELSAEEMQLLRIFRGLNDVGRARALESLEDMLQIPKYTDKSKESSISNAG